VLERDGPVGLFRADTHAKIKRRVETYYKCAWEEQVALRYRTPRVADDRGIADDCNIELGKALDVAKPGGTIFRRQGPEGGRRDAAFRGGFVGRGDPQKDVFPARLGAEDQRER
jgi:hypothetical protein